MKTESTPNTTPEAARLGFQELLVLALSVYVLGAMLAQMTLPLSPELNQLLDRIDFIVCLVFLADFGVRFHRAPAKLAFMKWGWIDLLSSIPSVDCLRWGRLVRVFRILRILRAFRSAKELLAFLYRNRVKSLAGTAVLSAILIVLFACIAILAVETDKDSNIKTPVDAAWWAISTITTVGYGDKFPVTVEGRVVASILMVSGVSLFGVLTGLFAKLFTETAEPKEEPDLGQLVREIRLLREKIERLEQAQRSPDQPPLPS